MIKHITRCFDWRPWDKDRKTSFFINLALGIAVGTAFFVISHLQFMEDFFNSTIDRMIRYESIAFMNRWRKCITAPAKTGGCDILRDKFTGKVVFIDIDDDTYVKWGEPLIFPRDRIARFIALAEKNGAKVVVLDILLDYPSGSPAGDKALRSVLEEVSKKKSPLKIVFPTMIRRSDGTARRNVYDSLIDANPNFRRGIPYLSLSKTDKVVRYIRYYDTINKRNGEQGIIWSVPVLAVALYSDDMERLAGLEAEILRSSGYAPWGRRHVLELSGGKKLVIGNNELFSNRIRFAVLPPGIFNSEGNLFTERILPDEVDALQGELKGKIVVIGTSSPDKEGWYPTPVGDMPGMYIIGNAVNLMLGDWQVRDTPLWVAVLLEFFIIVLASYLFAHFTPAVVRAITVGTGFVLVIPITYYFYSVHGIFINSTLLFINALIPLLGMGWHDMLRTVKKAIRTRGRSLLGME